MNFEEFKQGLKTKILSDVIAHIPNGHMKPEAIQDIHDRLDAVFEELKDPSVRVCGACGRDISPSYICVNAPHSEYFKALASNRTDRRDFTEEEIAWVERYRK